MFSENLKSIRKARGLTQEELAIRLNVVRQTVSKWEKGLSVPDAGLLIKMADILEVTVSELLGERGAWSENPGGVAEQLSRINEQLAVKNRRARRIWIAVAVILIAVVAFNLLLLLVGTVGFQNYHKESGATLEIPTEVVEVRPSDVK